MRQGFVRGLLAVGMLVLSMVGSNAQSGVEGLLQGRVTDATGAAVSGAKITLIQAAGGREQKTATTTTDAEGRYQLSVAGSGDHRLTIEAPGFSSVSRNLSFTAGQSSTQEIQLQAANVFETITVSGGDVDYRAETSTTAMRADIALRDTPQSIQVITKQVMEEQGAVSINDVVRNVSGVSVPNSSGARAQDFTIRGFTSSRNSYRDGFRNDFNSNRSAHELSNVERVEVLKGPASVLYGRLDPSGVVNMVTKKPLPEHYFSLTFYGGKYNFYRPQLDLSGPLNRNRTALYRLNAAYENADSFRQFNQRERLFLAPVVTWQAAEKTTLTFDGELMRGSSLIDRGLVALNDAAGNAGRGGIAPVPLGRFFGDPSIPYKYQQGRAGAQLYHVFDPNRSARSAFRITLNKANYHSSQPRRVRPDNQILELSLDFSDQGLQTYYWQNDINAKVDLGGLKHHFVFGFDMGRERFASNNLSGATRTINIFNPVYSFVRGPVSLRGDSTTVNDSGGLYAQDLIALRQNLKLLIGGRFDYYDQTNDNRFAGTRQNAIDRAWTPRLGLVYQPIEPVSLYVSYSRSFQPLLQQTYELAPFKPETGEQYEAGVKLDALDRRVTSTIAVYQVKRQNVTTADNRPGIPSGFSVQLGEQRSRGVEFDLSTRITRRWNALFSYGYTKAIVTNDNTRTGQTPIVGNVLQGTPHHTGSLWTSYELDKGLLRGLGAGAGLFGVGRRFGDNEHTFEVPGYMRADAAVFWKIYRADKLRYRLAVNLSNLLDKQYYEGVRGPLGVVPGSPFTGQVSAQVIF